MSKVPEFRSQLHRLNGRYQLVEDMLNHIEKLEQLVTDYVDIVIRSEGVDFLYESEWTTEQWQIFCDLIPELKDETIK